MAKRAKREAVEAAILSNVDSFTSSTMGVIPEPVAHTPAMLPDPVMKLSDDIKVKNVEEHSTPVTTAPQTKHAGGRPAMFKSDSKWGKMKKVGYMLPEGLIEKIHYWKWEKRTSVNGFLIMALEHYIEELERSKTS